MLKKKKQQQDFTKMQKGMKKDFDLLSFKILVVYAKWHD
jgi:hypothetical protein